MLRHLPPYLALRCQRHYEQRAPPCSICSLFFLGGNKSNAAENREADGLAFCVRWSIVPDGLYGDTHSHTHTFTIRGGIGMTLFTRHCSQSIKSHVHTINVRAPEWCNKKDNICSHKVLLIAKSTPSPMVSGNYIYMQHSSIRPCGFVSVCWEVSRIFDTLFRASKFVGCGYRQLVFVCARSCLAQLPLCCSVNT